MTRPALVLDVLIAHPSYGGNGGISSEHPDIRQWEVETVVKMKADARIGRIHERTIADTPITMVRNKFVTEARRLGAHLLLMVDSDQSPNKHKGESWFVPFWDAAFEKVYEHYGKGPVVVGAPYCGPPDGTENVYVFDFDNFGLRDHETVVSLDQYTRHHACVMTGVHPVAALPTGMILFDMRIFDLLEPSPMSKEDVLDALLAGKMTKLEALDALRDGWFYYEWKTQYADEKASTEDVTATRDIAFAGVQKLGYNPLYCAWDSWVGHHKPWCVGKPGRYNVEQIAASFRRACELGSSVRERYADFRNQWESAPVAVYSGGNGDGS